MGPVQRLRGAFVADDTVAKIKKQYRMHNSPPRILHFANSACPTPNRIVGKPPTTSGPTAEEECPEISIQLFLQETIYPHCCRQAAPKASAWRKAR